ncbi:MAG: lactate permease LctP family transporter [Deltaproteobacteria bacterium]|jgi:lactate permease|nr:lactate permease LctP family transporter [Deltaproteobacteria bacterium]
MAWNQRYDPLQGLADLGPDFIVSAAAAGLPLFILFYMLAVVRRANALAAASAGTGTAFALAVTLWGMPASLALSSMLMGACFGLFPIVWIVVSAVWIYRMTVESGEFEIIRDSLAGLTDDRRLQAILIAFAFGAFLEGTAGFGTPVAITAAMLVGLGFNPLYAAGICLIANTAPVAFGALGVPIETAARASGLDIQRISSIVGRQLPLITVILPFWLCCTMSGLKNTLEVLPAVLVSGVCFAGSQFLFSNFHGPYLPDVMSAVITIVGLLLLLRFWKPRNTWRFPGEKAPVSMPRAYPPAAVFRAWSSYVILAVMVFVWGLDAFKEALGPTAVSIPWPALDGLVQRAPPVVKAPEVLGARFNLNIMTAAGTAIFISGIIASLVMPRYGPGKGLRCLARTVRQLKIPILTIVTILGLSGLMNYSGMSGTLALAFTDVGFLFPFFAPVIGWLGVFLTGSDTSSNALFSGLQRTTAEVVGIDPGLAVAVNSTGGVTGKMISPQSIAVATAATGLIGQEGSLFRFTLLHSLAMTLIVCVLSFLQAYSLSWMLP